MKQRIGRVKIGGEAVGTIEEIDEGTKFSYSAEWLKRPGAPPVSLTLPVREEPYISKGLHPFFDNLLPEGWLLEVSTKTLRISKDDAFGLLLATCGDCIGAVELEPIGERSSGGDV